MATLWKDEYKVGIDKIDKQHKQLFDKIEQLLEIAKSGNRNSNQQKCMEIIDFLVDYTVFHFDTEEALQRDRKYISYTQHIKIHMDFKNTVQAYKEQLSKDFSAKTLKSFIGTMLAWLVNHVCVCDRKILKNMPLQSMESFANTESFIENVAHKLLTEMYDIPIHGVKSCIYKGNVEGAVIVRTVAEGRISICFYMECRIHLLEFCTTRLAVCHCHTWTFWMRLNNRHLWKLGILSQLMLWAQLRRTVRIIFSSRVIYMFMSTMKQTIILLIVSFLRLKQIVERWRFCIAD